MTYDQRLDHLLTTAAKVFADNGFHSTTMRDLSRATGMSLAGMYYYVHGKEDLLFRMQERTFTRVIAGAEEAVGGAHLPAEERLRRFVHHHVRFFAGHMAEMKVLSHEARSLSGDALESLNCLKRRYVDQLRGLLAAARGQERADVHTGVAAYALFGMMNWIYTWFDPAGPVSSETLADDCAAFALTGFVRPADHPRPKAAARTGGASAPGSRRPAVPHSPTALSRSQT